MRLDDIDPLDPGAMAAGIAQKGNDLALIELRLLG
jgi:hypothetical protein